MLEKLQRIKEASYSLPFLKDTQRQAVLHTLAHYLRHNTEKVELENAKDLKTMDQENPLYDRLLLNKARIEALARAIETIAHLPSPLDKVLEKRTRPNGLIFKRVAVPLGVVAVIYESRPNVTLDIFSLCFKSGNACVLKGGTEAYHTNFFLTSLIQKVLLEHTLDPDIILLCPPGREETRILLTANGLIDVCIPRGSQTLINFVRQTATVPIIETGAGVVHLYFDKEGDLEKGRAIIYNAKTRRVSVCNALDCLLIHEERLPELYKLIQPLETSKVQIFADKASYEALISHYPSSYLFHARPEDYGKEFLSYKIAIKSVHSMQEAREHIQHYTSGHSEAIITENKKTAEKFVQAIDAAVVYMNASTAFTDGGEFGMGAEIGISTQKLHARGPMGLTALTSSKWIGYGNGQVR